MNTPPWENIWICERFEIFYWGASRLHLGRFLTAHGQTRSCKHRSYSNQVVFGPPTTMIFHHRLCSFNTDRTPISAAQIPLFYSKNHISVVQKHISTTEYYWHYWSNRIFFLLNDVGFQCSREQKHQIPVFFNGGFSGAGGWPGSAAGPRRCRYVASAALSKKFHHVSPEIWSWT